MYLDINSMYPWIMESQVFPTGPGALFKNEIRASRWTYKNQIAPLNLYTVTEYKF